MLLLCSVGTKFSHFSDIPVEMPDEIIGIMLLLIFSMPSDAEDDGGSGFIAMAPLVFTMIAGDFTDWPVCCVYKLKIHV